MKAPHNEDLDAIKENLFALQISCTKKLFEHEEGIQNQQKRIQALDAIKENIFAQQINFTKQLLEQEEGIQDQQKRIQAMESKLTAICTVSPPLGCSSGLAMNFASMAASIQNLTGVFKEMDQRISALESKHKGANFSQDALAVSDEAATEEMNKRILALESICNSDSAVKDTSAMQDEVQTVEDVLRSQSLHTMMQMDVNNSCTYVIQSSVWDASIFLFHGSMGLTDSVYALLLIIINALMQWVMCYVVYVAMTDSKYGETSLHAYQFFRTLIAHDTLHMDKTSKISLAARVCNTKAHNTLHIATQQAQDVQNIDQYLQPMAGIPLGTILCSLALLAWYMTVTKEVQQVVSNVSAVLYLERSCHTHVKAAPGNSFRIASMSSQRMIALVLIGLIRIIACGYFYDVGTQFLVATSSLPELMLNTVALDFILNIDELIYAALAPSSLKTLVSQTEPLQRSSRLLQAWLGPLQRVDYSMIGSALLVFGVFTSALTSIQAEADTRRSVHNELCAGNKHFVYMDLPFGILNWAATDPYGMGPKNYVSTQYQHLRSVIVENEEAGLTKTGWGEFLGLPGYQSMSITDAGDWVSPSCADLENWPEHWSQHLPLFIGALRDQAKNVSVSRCGDVRHFCFEDSAQGLCVRLLCPETCGCMSPSSPNPFAKISMGCPERCQETEEYKESKRSSSCRELSPEELRNSTSWGLLVSNLRETIKDWQPGFRGLFQDVAALMWDQGCGAISGVHVFGEDIDLCTGRGSLNPIKNLQIWCPLACNCSQMNAPGDCPDSCKH